MDSALPFRLGCSCLCVCGSGSDFTLRSATFDSISLWEGRGAGPAFLCTGRCEKIEVGEVVFRNISRTHGKNVGWMEKREERYEEMVVESCTFFAVPWATEGTILSCGADHTSFQERNCTHVSCISGAWNEEGESECPLGRVAPTSGTNRYIGCNFTDMHGKEAYNGGAIAVTGNGILFIESCTFIRCTVIGGSSTGGAVHFDSTRTCDVRDSYFEACKSPFMGGACQFYNGSSQYYDSLTVINCSSQFYGGLSIFFSPENSVLLNSSFDSCFSDISGSGISVRGTHFAFSVVQCAFTSNVSPFGSLSVLNITNLKETPIKRMAFCWFDNNTGTNMDYNASDVYFDRPHAEFVKDHPEYFEECYSNSEGNHLYLLGTGAKNDWIPFLSCAGAINIDSSVETTDVRGDHFGCGKEEDACQTIGFGIKSWSPIPIPVIIAHSQVCSETQWNLKRRHIRIEKGEDVEKLVVKTGRDSEGQEVFCSISSGSLSLSSCQIEHTTGELTLFHLTSSGTLELAGVEILHLPDHLTRPVLLLDAGSAQLQDVQIQSSLSTGACPIIEFGRQGASLDILDTMITGITLSEGDGVGIKGTIRSGERVVFANSTLSSCETRKGNGGGMWIEMEDRSELEVGNPEAHSNTTAVLECWAKAEKSVGGCGGGLFLKLSENADSFWIGNVDFSGCGASKGESFFIHAPSLRAVMERSRFSNPFLNEPRSLYMGYESDNTTHAIPLVFYFQDAPDPIDVGGLHNRDFSACGHTGFPCTSLDFGFGIWSSNNTPCHFAIASSTQLANPIVIGAPSSFSSAGDGSKQEVEMRDSGKETGKRSYVFSGAETSFTNCHLRVKSEYDSRWKGLFETSKESLCFRECTITNSLDPSFEWGFSVVVVSGGSLTLGTVIIQDFTLSESGAIHLESVGTSVVLSNTSVVNIVRKKGDGCGMSGRIGEGKMVSLDGGSMSGKTREGNGGGVYLVMEAGSRVGVGNGTGDEGRVEVGGCRAGWSEERGGCGGGVYLECEGDGGAFTIGRVDFLECVARYGTEVFVDASDLSAIADKGHFVEAVGEKGEVEFMGFEGRNVSYQIPLVFYFRQPDTPLLVGGANARDFTRCGYGGYPCSTVSRGIELYFQGKGFTMQVCGATAITSAASFSTDSIKLMGKDEMQTATLSSKTDVPQRSFLSSSVDTCMANLSFVFAPAFSPSSANTALFSSSTTIAFTNCSFSAGMHEEAWVFSLLEVDGGDATMENCRIEGETHKFNVGSGHSLVLIGSDDGSSFLATSFTVSNISLECGSVVSVERTSSKESGSRTLHKYRNEDSTVCLSSSHFTNITGDGNRACVVSCIGMDVSVMELSGCALNACRSGESQVGGAMNVVLREGGSVSVRDNRLSDCQANSSEEVDETKGGRGGFLHVKCLGDDESQGLALSFVDLSFKNDSASVGRDLFIECARLMKQINETQFAIDLTVFVFNRSNAFSGSSRSYALETDVDLLQFMEIYQSDTVFVSSKEGASDEKVCGSRDTPCSSLAIGIAHLVNGFEKRVVIDESGELDSAIKLSSTAVKPKDEEGEIVIRPRLEWSGQESVVGCSGRVAFERLVFHFPTELSLGFQSFLSSSSKLLIQWCVFCPSPMLASLKHNQGDVTLFSIGCSLIHCESGGVEVRETTITGVHCESLSVLTVNEEDGHGISLLAVSSAFSAIAKEGSGGSVFSACLSSLSFHMMNCSFQACSSSSAKGSVISIGDSPDVVLTFSTVSGLLENHIEGGEVCSWSGSVVDLCGCVGRMEAVTIANSSKGGMSVEGGTLTIIDGSFVSNDPHIPSSPSVRRNMVCGRRGQSESSVVDVSSLKGEEGGSPSSSMWFLAGSCTVSGIGAERDSTFFIPALHNVTETQKEDNKTFSFSLCGTLLLPCGTMVGIVHLGATAAIHSTTAHNISDYEDENTAHADVSAELLEMKPGETGVGVVVLFECGSGDCRGKTGMIVIREAAPAMAESQPLVEGGAKSVSVFIVVICVLVVVLLLLVVVVIVQRMRGGKGKKKSGGEGVYVKDVEMRSNESEESSGDEDGRKEKKVEYVLYSVGNEDGDSQEALLGVRKEEAKLSVGTRQGMERSEERRREDEGVGEKDEGVGGEAEGKEEGKEEREENTEVVRGESPTSTTSSIDNLVEGITCEAPFEKVIVDTRDSLFERLHHPKDGRERRRNGKEREMEACRVLSSVLRGLNYIREMGKETDLFRELSSRCIMFGEDGAVIISQQAPHVNRYENKGKKGEGKGMKKEERGEKGERGWYENNRWRAPELFGNETFQGDEKTIVFSTGMLLYEFLTSQVPFDGIDALSAALKIANGERPSVSEIQNASLAALITLCLQHSPADRPSIAEVRQVLLSQLPQSSHTPDQSDGMGKDTAGTEGEEEGQVREMCPQPSEARPARQGVTEELQMKYVPGGCGGGGGGEGRMPGQALPLPQLHMGITKQSIPAPQQSQPRKPHTAVIQPHKSSSERQG